MRSDTDHDTLRGGLRAVEPPSAVEIELTAIRGVLVRLDERTERMDRVLQHLADVQGKHTTKLNDIGLGLLQFRMTYGFAYVTTGFAALNVSVFFAAHVGRKMGWW